MIRYVNLQARLRILHCKCLYAMLLLSLVLPACGRVAIEGVVVDVQGQTLPGVVVRVEGTDVETLSSGLGTYNISASPGNIVLTFSKTGYTPGRLSLDVNEPRAATATRVQLWRLPSTAGVYLFEDFQYKQLTWGEPSRYFMAEGDMAYASQRAPDLNTSEVLPTIICYKTPRYDARLTRMRKAQAKLAPGEASVFDVWTAAGTVQAELVPIDIAKGLLLQFRPEQPLEPGVYAIHWGAMDGYTALEKRIFTFRLLPPPVEALEMEDEVADEPGES